MLLHGGIYPVHLLMESFGRFLERHGLSANRASAIPATTHGRTARTKTPTKLAGIVAWDYEHDGVRPMLIGHSQGGMQAVKVLHELAGHFDKTLRVFDPLTGSFEERTTIVDPITRTDRPVVGVSVSYASAVGAGGAAFLLPNQWSMASTSCSRFRTPSTNSPAFAIPYRLSLPAATRTTMHDGTAKVRNVDLPVTYSHVFVPAVGSLAEEPGVRAWINAYVPGREHDTSSLPVEARAARAVGGRRLVQHQEALVPRSAALVRAERMRVPTQNAERNRIPDESAYRTNAPTESAAR